MRSILALLALAIVLALFVVSTPAFSSSPIPTTSPVLPPTVVTPPDQCGGGVPASTPSPDQSSEGMLDSISLPSPMKAARPGWIRCVDCRPAGGHR